MSMTDPEEASGQQIANFSLSKRQLSWLSVFAFLAFLSVAFGAFGAHALQSIVDEKALSWWQTGCHYMSYHALAGGFTSLFLAQLPRARVTLWSFLAGIVFFSGSLFTMSLSGLTLLGMITPIGGFLFLLGWGWLIFVFSCAARRT